MTSEPSFAELVERLQHDDRAAVGLLIERYGSALRRAIERALWIQRLVRAEIKNAPGPDPIGTDASDIFQTVLLLFLARLRRHRAGTGAALQFETPAHLVAYLRAIAQHELARLRRPRTVALSRAEMETGLEASPFAAPTSNEPTPSQWLVARELLEHDVAALAEVMRRLSPEERAIWDLVRQELSWPEIARRLGNAASPEAVRKTFARAVRRIAEELKTGDHGHD
jgi:RNA polymerase sigma factor (sigma-70 family)